MTSAHDPPEPDTGGARAQPAGEPVAARAVRQGERRWPMATAVLSVALLQELIPEDFRIMPRFVYPTVLGCFLAVLVIGDPGRIDRERRWLRVTTFLMFGLITLVTATSALRLVAGIFTDATFATASQLLIIGGVSGSPMQLRSPCGTGTLTPAVQRRVPTPHTRQHRHLSFPR